MGRGRLVLMGRASGGHGTKGEVKVHSHASAPEVFLKAGTFYAGGDPQSARPHELTGLRPSRGKLLFTVRGVTSREAADQFKGAWIYLAPEDLPDLPDDEYYWHQIKGLKVSTTEGLELGKVRKVSDHGAGELWEVVDAKGRLAIIPLIPGVLRELDLKAGRALVELPEGLLEAQEWGQGQKDDAG